MNEVHGLADVKLVRDEVADVLVRDMPETIGLTITAPGLYRQAELNEDQARALSDLLTAAADRLSTRCK